MTQAVAGTGEEQGRGEWPDGARKREAALAELRSLAPQLSGRGLDMLAEMYSAPALPGSAGPVVLHPDTRVTMIQGAQMHRLIGEHDARRSLEVGFAYGFSSVWMMDALGQRAGAHHTAIDPFQETDWGGVGLTQVARLGSDAGFRHVPDLSIFALTALEREGAKFDFIYIDGNHRFDDVLVDFYLCDRLVVPGGLLALDDLWMPSVRSVLSFVMQNRSYELVTQPAVNLAVIRKLGEDDRGWRHFRRFNVHRFEGVPPIWKRVPRRVIEKTRDTLRGARD